jgi:hypothetical protein
MTTIVSLSEAVLFTLKTESFRDILISLEEVLDFEPILEALPNFNFVF